MHALILVALTLGSPADDDLLIAAPSRSARPQPRFAPRGRFDLRFSFGPRYFDPYFDPRSRYYDAYFDPYYDPYYDFRFRYRRPYWR